MHGMKSEDLNHIQQMPWKSRFRGRPVGELVSKWDPVFFYENLNAERKVLKHKQDDFESREERLNPHTHFVG